MLEKALKYPLEREDKIKTLLIGGALFLLSPLILPIIVLLGYMAKTIQASAKNQKPPSITNFKENLVNGAKLITVILLYLGLILVLAFVGSVAEEINETLGLISFSVLTVFYLGVLVSYPAILKHFSKNMDINDAFRGHEIIKSVFNLQYLKVVLMLLLVSIILTLVQLLVGITIIGILALPSLIFYELVVSAQLIGQIKQQD